MVNEYYEKAINIVSEALKSKGQIKKTKDNREIFSDFYTVEVNEYLQDMISKFGLKVFIANDTMYFYPEAKTTFAFKESDIRKKMSLKNNSQVYLSYIILFIFIDEMFGGDIKMKRKREYISLNALQKAIDDFFEKVNSIENIDEETDMNYMAAGRCWQSLLGESDDSKKEPSVNSKAGFVNKVMNFYAGEYANLVEKREIPETAYFTTRKLEDYIDSGNLNIKRFNEIKELIEEEE